MTAKKSPVLRRRDKFPLFWSKECIFAHLAFCVLHIIDMSVPIEAESFLHDVKQLMLETMIWLNVWQTGEFSCKLQVNSTQMAGLGGMEQDGTCSQLSFSVQWDGYIIWKHFLKIPLLLCFNGCSRNCR